MEYLLENEFLQAAVSSQGAELVSIRDKAAGRELMWQADAGVWGRHAPFCFPTAGVCVAVRSRTAACATRAGSTALHAIWSMRW